MKTDSPKKVKVFGRSSAGIVAICAKVLHNCTMGIGMSSVIGTIGDFSFVSCPLFNR